MSTTNKNRHASHQASVQRFEARTFFSAYSISDVADLTTNTFYPGSQTNVVIDAHGNIFGTTFEGGPGNYGSIVEIPAGSKTIQTLDSFSLTNGQSPIAVALDSSGDLFGITQYGGPDAIANSGPGTLFEIPAGTSAIQTKISFSSGTNGEFPEAMTIDQSTGNIYVLFAQGGADGNGLISQISPTTFAMTSVASLNNSSRTLPNSLSLGSNGHLYGTIFGGDNGTNGGTVFDVTISSGAVAEATLPTGATDPNQPYVDPSGNIWLTSENGGSVNVGAVYEIPAGTTTVNTVASFSDTAFFDPITSLTPDSSGNLYGTTAQSSGSFGSVFKFSTTTSALTELATFSTSTLGSTPEAGLAADGSGNFYGTTTAGGANGTGVIFEASPSANGGGGGPVAPPTTGVTPTVIKSTVPISIVSGTKIKGTVSLSITNSGATVNKGPDTIAVYATTDGAIDGTSTLIGSKKIKLPLKAGQTAKAAVGLTPQIIPVGTYTLLTKTTDASGNVVTASTGPSLAVAAPFIALSAVVGPVAPSNVAAGKYISFKLTITNAGNINSTGPAVFAVGLSTDGSTLALPLSSVKRSVTIKAGGKAATVSLKIKVPRGTVTGTFDPFITFTQGSDTFSVAGASPVTIG